MSAATAADRPAMASALWREHRARILRFGIVGAAGFGIDAAVLAGLRAAAGAYLAQLVAFLVAAVVTWALNRRWTFAGRDNGLRLHEEGTRYLGANVISFVVTNGLYSALVYATPVPVFTALAIAAAVSAAVSYAVNNTFVFKERAR